MIKIKEGFKGERLVSLPEELLVRYSSDPLIKNLYVRKIGFFPKVKFHYVSKDQGCDYYMLIYCVDGQGWCQVGDRRYEITPQRYILIPSGVAYSFGADSNNPWTIYWLHFKGELAGEFVPAPSVNDLDFVDSSRLQERLGLFEEIYSSFAVAYTREHMVYASMCLYQFLASFTFVEQYRYIKSGHNVEMSLSAMAIRYMQENIAANITLEQLCEKFKYSQSHLSAIFIKETGMSPINYFIRLKVQKACEYIELTNLKINEVATKLGYSEATYFTRIFTKVMGVSPTLYRKMESEHNASQ